MEAQNRNRRMPCSEWRKWDQVIYSFQLPPNEPYYALPRELSASITRDGVDRLWFVDNADSCVRMRLWREDAILFISAKDVKKLLKFSTDRTDVGIQLQHLNQRVFSAQMLTHDLVPLEPFPNSRFYAGRVLPGHVQNQLAWRYHVLFDDRRQQHLQEEYLFEEVYQANSNFVPKFGSRTVIPWE